MRRIGYQNAVLTGIAIVLAIGVVDRGGITEPAAALAQPDVGGLSNALEQRKQIINELRTLNSKIERLESKLSSGISVKVTDMPPLKLPPETRSRAGQGVADPAAPGAAEPRPSADAGAGGK